MHLFYGDKNAVALAGSMERQQWTKKIRENLKILGKEVKNLNKLIKDLENFKEKINDDNNDDEYIKAYKIDTHPGVVRFNLLFFAAKKLGLKQTNKELKDMNDSIYMEGLKNKTCFKVREFLLFGKGDDIESIQLEK